MRLTNMLRKLGVGFYASIKRYPITLLFSTSVAILLIIISEMDGVIDSAALDNLSRSAMIAAMGIPLSLCARALYERKSSNTIQQLILYYGIGIMIQILYYYFFLKDMSTISTSRWIGVNLILYLCFLFIPYLVKKENFEMHVIHLFTNFLITYVYSGVLFAGLSAILFATDHLLGIPIDEEFYYYTLLMVALVFAPAYFLSSVPGEKRKESFQYSKILRVLLLYIVMPLLTAYTLILYLYFGKIIITMEWPQGLVSHLVLWYALILTMVLFLITPIQVENKWSEVFSRWFPRIVLPILIMMFVSMGIRIQAYGFTENRYYVLVLGLWIFATMIYLTFTKKKKNIFLLMSFSLVIMISTFGPLSSFTISKNSQQNRLENLLIENNMLENDEIKGNNNISIGDQRSISSILMYFESNHSLKEIFFLPEGFEMSQMEDTFGFPIQYSTPSMNEYFYYLMDMKSASYDISGYDYLLDSNGFYTNDSFPEDYHVELLPNSNILSVSFNRKEIFTIDLNNFVEDLHRKYGNSSENTVQENEFIMEGANQEYRYKIILLSIGGENQEGIIIINDINLYLLLNKTS